MLTRDEALSRISVTDDEIKAVYEPARAHTISPRSAASPSCTFPDKAAAEKAYAELSKAKDFNEAAAKLGFPAADIDLGLLTRPEMIDPKIADAAFEPEKERAVEAGGGSVLGRAVAGQRYRAGQAAHLR